MKDSYRIVRPFVLTALWLLASLCISSAVYAQTCVAPPSGLVSWWPLDETSGTTAADIIDANDGIHVNGPTPVAGQVVGALSFDGVDDFVSIPHSSAYDFGGGDFTIDFWIKTSDFVGGQRFFLAKSFNGANFWTFSRGRGYQRSIVNSNGIDFEICTGNSCLGDIVQSTSVINDGQFHHVAATRKAGELTLYVDGTLEML